MTELFRPSKEIGFQCDKRLMPKPKAVLAPEKCGTVVDETEYIDLVELAESYRDECGMSAMFKLIKAGQLDPAKLADDGQHGVDLTDIPDNLNDAYQKQLGLRGALAAAEIQLGLAAGTLTEENYSQVIKDTVEAQIKAAAASATATEGGNE